MPFTFAHPAIVLPLARLNKRWVSVTGLVVGAMVPDFEYFIRLKVASMVSHTLSGLFTFDLPLGILLVVLYQVKVKHTLIIHLPQYFRSRFCGYLTKADYLRWGTLVMCVSILLGAASHLLWDSFTHENRYFVDRLNLGQLVTIGKYQVPIYKLLQHGSTLLGFVAIAWCIKSLPKTDCCPQSKSMLRYWVMVAGVTGFLLVIKMMVCSPLPSIGDLIVAGISGVLLGILAASLLTQNNRKNQYI